MNKFRILLSAFLMGCGGLLIYVSHLSTTQSKLRLDSFHTIQIENAKTPESLKQGLMYRTQLPKKHGMLFHFAKPNHWRIWMKNTLIPLDIIWINSNKRVIYYLDNVQPCNTPFDCPTYKPQTKEKALYVLEIAAGERERLHIHLHQKLDF